MDLSLSQEQTTLRDSVRRYCRENYDLQSRQQILRSPEGCSPKHWAEFAQLGWLGAALPEAWGGSGGSVIEAAIILEEFGRVLVLEPYLACAILAAQAVSLAADPQRGRALLEPMVQGTSILALAHAEHRGAPGVCAVATSARRAANGEFVLNGSKSLVPGGNSAHRFIVSARTSASIDERHGISLFVVEQSAPGLSRRSFRTLDGSGAADLSFNDVRLPADALLGPEGGCLEAVERALDFGLVGLCSEALGSMDCIISTTADYLKTRRAYGTTLSTFQALQHRLADMLVELEMSRSLLYGAFAAFSRDDREEQRRAASAAKAFIGRAGKFVAAHGIQLHGAMGMVDDYIIGQQFKRLTVVEGLFGHSDFHLQRRFHS